MTRLGLVGAALLLMVALATFLAGAPAAAAQTQGEPYAERFDVAIDLQSDGSFIVTETQIVRFASSPARHGFREIPLDRVESISDVAVASTDIQYRPGGGSETANSYDVTRQGKVLRVDWYFPPTANASRTFVLRYRVLGGLRYYEGGDQLYWKAVYDDRGYLVRASQVTVLFPAAVSESTLKVGSYPEQLGVQGQLVDDRTLRFNGSNLPAGTGLEIRVQFPHGLVSGSAPEWQTQADQLDWYQQNVRPSINLGLGGGRAAGADSRLPLDPGHLGGPGAGPRGRQGAGAAEGAAGRPAPRPGGGGGGRAG